MCGGMMGSKIYISGASGTGTSTLAQALAAQLKVPHVDVDDAYWLPTDPPFRERRRVEDRIDVLQKALRPSGWVLSGSFDRWGDPLISGADLILFLTVPTAIRLARLRLRERRRFGARILAGGDMAATHAGFMAWASRYDEPEFSGRNRARHERWLNIQKPPVLRLDGTCPISKLTAAVTVHAAINPELASAS